MQGLTDYSCVQGKHAGYKRGFDSVGDEGFKCSANIACTFQLVKTRKGGSAGLSAQNNYFPQDSFHALSGSYC